MTPSLTERLERIRAEREKSKARIALKSGRHQSVSFEFAKFMRQTLTQLKLETKLEKKARA